MPFTLSTFGHFLSYLKVRVDIAGGGRASYEIKRSMRCLYCIETRGKMELLILTYVTSDITYVFVVIVLFYCFVERLSLCKTLLLFLKVNLVQCQDNAIILDSRFNRLA